jgi:acetyl esterase/lipase
MIAEALISALLGMLSPGGYTLHKDVAYADGPRGMLDVYTPKDVAPGAPVVVFFYGGGWDSGDKGFYRFVGATLASQGVVAVVPDYRVYPEVNWPGFVEDGAKAVAWTKAHVAQYGGDPGRMALMGHSAGAYNAAELAYDKRWLNAVGMDPARDIRAVVGVSGPYDFLPLHTDKLRTIFGPEAQRPDTQPINHVDGRGPPGLFVTGSGDTTVDPGNTTRMTARINQAGGHAEAKIYPGVSHSGTITALLPIWRKRAPTLADAISFIRAHTGPAASARKAA